MHKLKLRLNKSLMQPDFSFLSFPFSSMQTYREQLCCLGLRATAHCLSGTFKSSAIIFPNHLKLFPTAGKMVLQIKLHEMNAKPISVPPGREAGRETSS